MPEGEETVVGVGRVVPVWAAAREADAAAAARKRVVKCILF